ncbi:MAG: acetate/propionate family kinase [Lachnospiraceae bacterium]|nr:acetate/propionate family kinase [Lachnospiraceae bacterium]
MKILVSNVGSTSLKFKLCEMPEEIVLCTGKVERVGSEDAIFAYKNLQNSFETEITPCRVPSYTEGIGMFTEYLLDPRNGVLQEIGEIRAVGFKTVAAKGYNGIHEITGEVLQAMRDYMPVAPAHNTAYLEAIGCFREMLPGVMFVGVFETAFHQTIPAKRKIYSLPYEWYEKYGIQKLGYHGASHSYSAGVLTELFGSTGKAVTCHLGGSGSLCAVSDGKSVDTSFGMSLQIGLPQNNRVGDLDPYVIRYLEAQGLSEEEIYETMTKKSGLLGVSGVGRDLRYLMDAAKKGNDRAQLAIDMFTDSILHYIGAYAAEMGGLDNLVFTGGIGENSEYVREKVCSNLGFLGLVLDKEANGLPNSAGIRTISAPDSKVRVLVIPADEEIVVSRRTYEYYTEWREE